MERSASRARQVEHSIQAFSTLGAGWYSLMKHSSVEYVSDIALEIDSVPKVRRRKLNQDVG